LPPRRPWDFREELAVDDDRAAVFILIRRIGGLIGDVAHLAIGQQQRADRLGIGDRIDQSLSSANPSSPAGKTFH
jgi:hypothetical protein